MMRITVTVCSHNLMSLFVLITSLMEGLLNVQVLLPISM